MTTTQTSVTVSRAERGSVPIIFGRTLTEHDSPDAKDEYWACASVLPGERPCEHVWGLVSPTHPKNDSWGCKAPIGFPCPRVVEPAGEVGMVIG